MSGCCRRNCDSDTQMRLFNFCRPTASDFMPQSPSSFVLALRRMRNSASTSSIDDCCVVELDRCPPRESSRHALPSLAAARYGKFGITRPRQSHSDHPHTRWQASLPQRAISAGRLASPQLSAASSVLLQLRLISHLFHQLHSRRAIDRPVASSSG